MEDDIFSQLSSLFDTSSGSSSESSSGTSFGFGGTPSLSGSSDISQSSMEANMFEYDGIITPDVKPLKKQREKKLVVVLDDDFSTLDLMKIYLQRDYEIETFDNPKNAIFFLNGNVPDLIFIDSYLTVMNTKRVLDIIRTYKELADVPIVFLSEPSEHNAMLGKIPDGISDIIERPVKRGDLQRILDTYLKSVDGDATDEEQ